MKQGNKSMLKWLISLGLLLAAPALAQQFPYTPPFGPGDPPACVSAATESSHICLTRAGNLFGFQANNTNASSRWILVFDLTAVPTNGSVTPKKWYQIGANSTIGVSWGGGPPAAFANGIVIL